MTDEYPRAAIRLVQSNSLTALVQLQLERMILSGDVRPGQKLSEIPLAGQLGVSRGPVREALRVLEEKGLVRVEKNRGVFVRTITANEADEIYELRRAYEEIIVRKLAACPAVLDGAGLAELLERAAVSAARGDVERCHRANLEFHDSLARLTGSSRLLDGYRRLVNELALFRHHAHARVADASTLRSSVAEHQAILAAIDEGDGERAAGLVAAHLEASRQRTQALLDDEADPAAWPSSANR